jgi:cytidylate kinase
MTSTVVEEVVEQLADHRLEWDRIKHRIGTALLHEAPLDSPDHHMGPFIAVSRMAGAGGSTLAHQLGDALRWPVLGSEIVDLIGETFQLDPTLLHLLDDAKANWVRDVLGELIPHEIMNLDTYVSHLSKVMRLVAMHGHVILVGRGGQFFLPGSRGVTIRLVASEQDRAMRIAAEEHIDANAARAHNEDIDRRRAHFAKHYFNRDVDDPSLYDLVLNHSRLTDDELLDIVLALVHRRGYDS